MSEPIAERLSRFTPDSGGLDRDALLFAAGRVSARSSRPWKAVAAALAVSQLLTLEFLWPRTRTDPPMPPISPLVVAPSPPIPAPESSQPWLLSWRLLNDQGDLPLPVAQDDLVADDPPLRASSAPAALLN